MWQKDRVTNATVLQPPHFPIPTSYSKPSASAHHVPAALSPATLCSSMCLHCPADPILSPCSQSLLSHLPDPQCPCPQTLHPCILTNFTNLTTSPLCPQCPCHLGPSHFCSISQPEVSPVHFYTFFPITPPISQPCVPRSPCLCHVPISACNPTTPPVSLCCSRYHPVDSDRHGDCRCSQLITASPELNIKTLSSTDTSHVPVLSPCSFAISVFFRIFPTSQRCPHHHSVPTSLFSPQCPSVYYATILYPTSHAPLQFPCPQFIPTSPFCPQCHRTDSVPILPLCTVPTLRSVHAPNVPVLSPRPCFVPCPRSVPVSLRYSLCPRAP